MTDVTVCDGKYRYIFNADGAKALRHGEEWRDCTGDGLILALAQDLEEAREERDALAAYVEQLKAVFIEGLESTEDHDLDAWEEKAEHILAEQPTTTLTRRDLIKQAEVLDDLAKELAKKGHNDAAQTARIRAHVIGQQANQLEAGQ